MCVDDPDAQGPYAVGHTQITVASVGDRVLPVELWWPAEPGAVSDLPLTSYVLQDPIALPSTVAYVDAPVAEGAFPLLVFSQIEFDCELHKMTEPKLRTEGPITFTMSKNHGKQITHSQT